MNYQCQSCFDEFEVKEEFIRHISTPHFRQINDVEAFSE